ncbi:hypothetical protein [Clostridium gallinarum]|nr:hypothetical protein [Clostridium gallinarum]
MDLYVKSSMELIEVANIFLVGHEIGHNYYGHTTTMHNDIVNF